MGQSRILALRKRILAFHAQTAAWAAFLTLSAGGAYIAVFLMTAYVDLWWINSPARWRSGP